MVDYSEGYLNLKRMVDQIWQAIMDDDMPRAKELCISATAEARLLHHQIGLQSDAQRKD